ncbi:MULTISPECIES: STAS domain-containing protein [Mycobacterium]|uniref:Anti-sigma factor antagonist n=1 Tax=Mycobacterium lehmannii TaxID=2048550 RepID=A0A101A9Z0_9MYCO|nr:STAS domain-containing protein [Mycobacterium lehmannii]KUH93675.1 anti-anti-sigma factor [Mycolicibacterium acapulense]KUI06610.1 anti-anti-sigma factor [Mycolicibacterium acapulense]KUI10318.1 anti-anti-sigma factor [Mycolicibacterium acapulense]KUI19079.1 anti-anti-sigma factor [Mycobacterium lehmannii]
MDGQLCTENWVGRVAVVAASGDLDMLTAPQLRDAVQAALGKDPVGLIVDLTSVEFLGSAGMQVLMETHNQTDGTATKFAVVADGSATSRPLKITGIADLIDLFSSLDAALDNITA